MLHIYIYIIYIYINSHRKKNKIKHVGHLWDSSYKSLHGLLPLWLSRIFWSCHCSKSRWSRLELNGRRLSKVKLWNLGFTCEIRFRRGLFGFLSSKKKQKEGRWWSRTFLMLLEIQKKSMVVHRIFLLLEIQKKSITGTEATNWAVTGMQATAFYIRVCLKIGYPSNLRVHHRISGWNGYDGDAPFSDTPSNGFATCPTSSALLATDPSLVHGDSYEMASSGT